MATIIAKANPKTVLDDLNTSAPGLSSALGSYASTSSTFATVTFLSDTSADGYLFKITGIGLPRSPISIFSPPAGSITKFEVSRLSAPSDVLVSWQGDGSSALFSSLMSAVPSGTLAILSVFLTGADTLKASYDPVDIIDIPNLENIILQRTAIEAMGNDMANLITGNKLSNKLSGGAGNDTLIGGLGSDTMIGGDGNDRLNGGADNDILTGGLGADIFRFSTVLGATNVDQITDFTLAQGDRIKVDNAIFTGLLTPGTLAPLAFFIGAAATTSTQRILYNFATGSLAYDEDGFGGTGAKVFATLTPGLALTNTFFSIT